MVYIEPISYVFIFIMMSIITSIMKQNNVFISAFYPVLQVLPDRLKLIAICMVCGLLPVPGRIMITSMCLTCSCKSNSSNGLLAYLVSHHYYLWSPLEKTVLLPIAVLGISYGDLFIHMCIPLFVYICYTLYIINRHRIDPVDIHCNNLTAKWDMLLLISMLGSLIFNSKITIHDASIPMLLVWSIVYSVYMIVKYRPKYIDLYKSINFSSIIIILVFILIGTYMKQNLYNIEHYFTGIDIWHACVISFILSFLMGSSGKFAGLCVLTTTVYGLDWFVLFFIIDYIGYLISPFHKCLPIAVMNFKTPIKVMFLALLPLCIMLLLYGVMCTAL